MNAVDEAFVPAQESFLCKGADTKFRRDDENRILLTVDRKTIIIGSMAMVFPLSNRNRGVVLRDDKGEEIGILDDIGRLDAESKRIVIAELEKSYFMPRITDILDVTEELGVVTWKVETDRGPRTFQVRHVRQTIRRIGRRRVVILDVDGNRYDIPDWTALPPRAQRYVERYL